MMNASEGFPEGIYFGLEEETYHKLPMISSTGIKSILISPSDFWESSWMNPDKEEQDESLEWRVVGHAYHKRICEGKEAFYNTYCPSFEPPKDCLRTISDMKESLEKAGISSKTKWKKPDYINNVQAFVPDAVILDVEKARYNVKNSGKTQLDYKLMRRIETAAEMIENHPENHLCFKDGFPEVSIIWKEESENEEGKKIVVWFKARLDYMKVMAFTDLKTFANKQGKVIEDAIYSAMANQKYQIQLALYMNAMDKAIEFAKQEKWTDCNINENSKNIPNFIKSLSQTEEPTAFHIWQKKEGAPVSRGMQMLRGMLYENGQMAIQMGVKIFTSFYEKYGECRWNDETPIKIYDDESIPPWGFVKAE